MAIKKTTKKAKNVKKARPTVSKVHAKKVMKTVMKHKKVVKKIKAVHKQQVKAVKKPVHISKKILAQRAEELALNNRRIEDSKKVESFVGNEKLISHISGGVGAGAVDILKILASGPRTDEGIAEKMGVKVNDVRRMLNAMNSYSIVRYDVNKDNKGWLIFTWRIDTEKLGEYVDSLMLNFDSKVTELPGNCNDFFVCKGCYTKDKTVLPFESAYETSFSCGSCGKPYAQLSRDETIALFKT